MKIRLFQYILLFFLLASCGHPTASPLPDPPEAFILTITPIATPTFTPEVLVPIPATPIPIFKASIKQPSFCHNGPNENYLGAIPLPADTVVDVLAMNSDGGDWFMIEGEKIDPCWVKVVNLNLSPNFDPAKILVYKTIFTLQNSPCYVSYDARKNPQTTIPKGWRIVVYGKSNPNAEWILVVPHDSTSPCWVERSILPDFRVEELIVVSAEISTIVAVNPQPDPTRTRRPASGGGNTPTGTNIPGVSPTNTSNIPPTIPTLTPTLFVPPTNTHCYPPSAPSLRFTPANGNNFTLSWSAVTGATKYRVHRSGGGVSETTGTSATVEVKNNQSFTFQVTAINVCGEGPASNSVTISR